MLKFLTIALAGLMLSSMTVESAMAGHRKRRCGGRQQRSYSSCPQTAATHCAPVQSSPQCCGMSGYENGTAYQQPMGQQPANAANAKLSADPTALPPAPQSGTGSPSDQPPAAPMPPSA